MLTAQGELGRGPLLLPHVENEKGWRHKFYCFLLLGFLPLRNNFSFSPVLSLDLSFLPCFSHRYWISFSLLVGGFVCVFFFPIRLWAVGRLNLLHSPSWSQCFHTISVHEAFIAFHCSVRVFLYNLKATAPRTRVSPLSPAQMSGNQLGQNAEAPVSLGATSTGRELTAKPGSRSSAPAANGHSLLSSPHWVPEGPRAQAAGR